MLSVPDGELLVTQLAVAASLLAARTHLVDLGLAHPSAREILSATGVGRSRAYELAQEVPALLAALDRPPGRPPTESRPRPENESETLAKITQEVLSFVMDHPGCVHGGSHRRRYSESLRKHVLELHEGHPDLNLLSFATAIGVPSGTLEDWLRTSALADTGPAVAASETEQPQEAVDLVLAKVETLLVAHRGWQGNFTSFCAHVREHLRLDFGNSLIATILYEHGERTPKSRGGRTPDEESTRGSFETFFPGAQWVGDGKAITVTIDDKEIDLNFELIVDADSGAFVGVSFRDEEDSAAVTMAFEEGVTATGEQPIALLLDNRPSNHTEDVDDALGETIRIRATPFRPQNKAHAEGAFGLFAQAVPEMTVVATDPKKLAEQIARLVITTWARTLNHRPRRGRGGKSRVELYSEGRPTPEQIEEAKRALSERLRRQELARATFEARLDPIIRTTLDDAFARLELLDPERHARNAIARYPLDAIVDGIGIFEGKRKHGSLPPGADARYLLGIVRNLHHVHEAEAITTALLDARITLRDRMLLALDQERRQLCANAEGTANALRLLVDKALTADRSLDRSFWLEAIAKLIRNQPSGEWTTLCRGVARRIHATFSASRADRAKAERTLARAIWPIE